MITPEREPAAAAAAPAPVGAAFDLAFYTPLHQHRAGADTKAGSILTAAGLMYTVLAHNSPAVLELFAAGGASLAAAVLLLLAFVGFTLGAVMRAFSTISPRFPPAPPSLAFFGDVARLSREEYVARMEALTEEQALQHLLNYNHTLSTIVVEKFRQLAMAVRCFEWAFACWLLLMGLIGLRVLL